MNSGCVYEKAVLSSATSGQWEERVQAHVSACSVCQDIVRVSQWIQTLAETSGKVQALPDTNDIWWKAQLLKKQAAEERATRPIFIIQTVTYIAVALGMAGYFIWKWPQIQERIAELKTVWFPSLIFRDATLIALPFVHISIVLLCLTAFLTLRTILAED